MTFHPPAQEVRKTIEDFKGPPKTQPVHHESCACCKVEKPSSNAREFKVLAVIVAGVTLMLVALNAYQREQAENEYNQEFATSTSLGGITSLGPGATQAAEVSFPAKSPTQPMYYSPVTQQAYVPLQMTRPGEPALKIMAVPHIDSRGNSIHRLKRVVSR